MPVARSVRQVGPSYQATRFLSTSRHDGAVKPPLQHLERQPQPTVTTDDGHRSLRKRQHGNKSLPLPPLLDEKVIAAKEKFRGAKASEHEGEATEFQRQLRANVFAQALATEVRQCHITRARLPVFFLQPFTAHTTSPTDEGSEDPSTAANRPIRVTLEPKSRQCFLPSSILPTSTYALATKPMMEYLGKKRTWGRIVDQCMQDQYAKRIGKKDAKKVDISKEWNWDAEMADVVLQQLRRVVHSELAMAPEDDSHLSSAPIRGQARIQPMPGKGERDNVAGVLVRSAADLPSLENSEDEELAAIFTRGPVYVLQDLLDLNGYNSVCEQFDLRNRGSVLAIPAHSPVTGVHGLNTPLLAALHRLQIYLGRDAVTNGRKG